MKRQHKPRVKLNDDERKTLQKLKNKPTAKQGIVLRARIVLLADEGLQHQAVAQTLGIQNNTVSTWIARWNTMADKPVEMRLQDLPRTGAPDTFTPEQLCQIIAIACESPKDYDLPITSWTHRELAKTVIKEGIVDSISASHLGTLLKKTTYNPIEVSIG
jgi:putative transposase